MRVHSAKQGETIVLGKQGENLATQILFPVVKEWTELFGNGTFGVMLTRHGETTSYPVETSVSENNVSFVVSNTDVFIAGRGSCELVYVVGDAVAKSATYNTLVLPSPAGGETPPEPGEDWAKKLLDAAEKTGTTFIPSVNEGVLSWTNDGGLENPTPVDIVAEVIEDLPKYSGSYTVTPLVRESKLDTQNKVMTDDIHVEAIPYYEVSNNSGGETAVIGQP